MKRNKNIHKKNWAFTLLELLVVIGMISVLVGLGTFSYSTAQKKARDSKRKGDLQAIHNALEQYYSICGFTYPDPTGTAYGPVICTTPAISVAIMTAVPVDPRTTTPYYCDSSVCNSTSYTLCANNLESESPTGYCIQNQQ